MTQTMSYDRSGQLTQIEATNSAGGIFALFVYSYTNPATRLPTTTRYSVHDQSFRITSYTYDAVDQLTGAQTSYLGYPLSSSSYALDPVGNLTSTSVNGTTTPMSYNPADELTTAGSRSYSYDPNGNQLGSSGGVSLSYNNRDQTVSLAYTGPGQVERTANGQTSYQDDLLGIGAMTSNGQTTYFTDGPTGEPISERIPGGAPGCSGAAGTFCTSYYLYDGLGSVVALTDSSGNLVNSYSYDPYGNVVGTPTEGVPNPFRFEGAIWDASTGLLKMGDRYYDPTIGRFTQEDPLGGGYSYVGGNPVNFIDPSGDYSSDAPDFGGGGFAGGDGCGCTASPTRGGVYTLENDDTGETEYVGQSSDLRAREADHRSNPDKGRYRFQVRHYTDDYEERRGLEQHEYNRRGRPRLNRQRPIARGNPNRARYLRAARNHLRQHR